MVRSNRLRPYLATDPRLSELEDEVRQFITDVTDENTPEISTTKLNRVIKRLLKDDTPEGAEIREVMQGCLWDAKEAQTECEKFKQALVEETGVGGCYPSRR
jgi:hypothetical protein